MPCTSGASTSAPSTTTVGSTIAHAYQWRSKLRRRRPGSRVGRSGASGSDGAGAGVTSVADIGPPGTAGTTGGETGGRVVRRAGAPPVEPPLGAGLHGRRGGSLGGVVRDRVALVLLSGLVESLLRVLALDHDLGGHLVERTEEQATLGDPRTRLGDLERGLPGSDLLVVLQQVVGVGVAGQQAQLVGDERLGLGRAHELHERDRGVGLGLVHAGLDHVIVTTD